MAPLSRSMHLGGMGAFAVLYGLIREEEGTGAELLEAFGVNETDVKALLGPRLDDPPGSEAGQPALEPAAERAIERAAVEARWESRDYAATEHLLMGVLHESQGAALRLLLDAGVGEDDVRKELARRRR